MNYFENKKTIPRFIKNKITFIKVISFFQILFSLFLFLFLSFILFLYYNIDYKNKIFKLNTNINFIFNKIVKSLEIELIPYPFLLIFLLIIFFLVFIYGCFNLKMIKKQAKKYKLWLKNDENTIPEFIYSVYKKSIVYKIIANWFCSFSYIVGVITLSILIWLQYQYINNENIFYLGFWKIGTIKNLQTEIIITSSLILLFFVLHCFCFIHFKKTKTQIISYWGTDILSLEEKKYLKRKTNWICFIIIAILLTITLFSIYIIIKKLKIKNNKKLLS
ncbi:hypothetical protein SATRI_v1c01830 [Spiroplasma atrichopogonis]|nr:hypothetical protein SATRI_v1c01830 [Spiroplasma atrichopogonis]